MVGDWEVFVTVFKFPEFSDNQSYQNSFLLTILPAREVERPETGPNDDIWPELLPKFDGIVVLEELEQV